MRYDRRLLSGVTEQQQGRGDRTKEASMKHASRLWFTVVLMGLALTSSAYAVSFEEEAQQVVMDYFLRSALMRMCVESFYLAPHDPQDLHRCEGCMDFQRGVMCRTAVSTDVNIARLTARDLACDALVHSTAEDIACGQTPPARVTCRAHQAEAVKQGQEVSVTVRQDKVSAAEKRKGTQWKGTGSLEAKIIRTDAHPPWSPWYASPIQLYITIIKANGKWTVHPNDEIRTLLVQQEATDCQRREFVPK